MRKKPYVISSSAISIDGYIDDSSDKRLILSHPKDLDRVDTLRAQCDAILVGANTLRKDNPGLLIHSKENRNRRIKKGLSPDLVKVTITKSGELDKRLEFFTSGSNKKLVYCTQEVAHKLRESLNGLAEIVSGCVGNISPFYILENLYNRNVKKLLIEGGREINTQFLQNNLIDELQIAIAPFFVGDINAPTFVGPGAFSYDKKMRMTLNSVEKVGDMAVLTYLLKG